MIYSLRHRLRILWCRLTGGHQIYMPRSLEDGAVLSIMCRRCPLQEEGE